MPSQVLIIGAGAAGLVAARRLSAAGYAVALLEAAAEAGGRIHTVNFAGFPGPVEAGAEFVHGDLPITAGLAREAAVALLPTRHERLEVDRGDSPGPSHWDELMREMSRLQKDMPVKEFLATHFDGEQYARLRESVSRFAQGYDLADPARASTKALYAEWSSEEDSSEYRPEGGYGRLVDFLVRECRRLHAVFHFASPVAHVRWQPGKVEAITAGGEQFQAARLLITVSTAVLPRLVFTPAIPEYIKAARGIGWGSVIKILFEFRTRWWWEKEQDDKSLFILSRQSVPTWWTQAQPASSLLTGWLTGENMRRFKALDEKDRVETCLKSLAAIFSVEIGFLKDQLAAFRFFDWEQQPFVHGGYSYDLVGTPECRSLLTMPVADTLYFAGEAVYEGQAPGTVEAAFHSGIEAAEKIIARHKPRY